MNPTLSELPASLEPEVRIADPPFAATADGGVSNVSASATKPQPEVIGAAAFLSETFNLGLACLDKRLTIATEALDPQAKVLVCYKQHAAESQEAANVISGRKVVFHHVISDGMSVLSQGVCLFDSLVHSGVVEHELDRYVWELSDCRTNLEMLEMIGSLCPTDHRLASLSGRLEAAEAMLAKRFAEQRPDREMRYDTLARLLDAGDLLYVPYLRQYVAHRLVAMLYEAQQAGGVEYFEISRPELYDEMSRTQRSHYIHQFSDGLGASVWRDATRAQALSAVTLSMQAFGRHSWHLGPVSPEGPAIGMLQRILRCATVLAPAVFRNKGEYVPTGTADYDSLCTSAIEMMQKIRSHHAKLQLALEKARGSGGML